MSYADSIGFSIRLYAFFAEQDRMLNSSLHSEGRISYSELSLMQSLYEVNEPVALEPIAQLLMFHTRTVRQMMLDLEDKGFVVKQNDPADGRFMLSRLSEKGRAETEKSVTDCYQLMRESLWEALPESDMQESLKVNMRQCVNHIRGFTVELFGERPRTDLPIAVDHFIFWRVVVDRWMRIVRKSCDLSLNDFCVLRCLFERGTMIPSEVAADLLLPRSVLSLCKRHLSERAFLVEHEGKDDGREIFLTCTPEGERIAEEVFALLDEATREAHRGMSEEDTDLVNAWYARMFRNMWRAHKS